MDSDLLGLVELLLVFGLVLGLSFWELARLRRANREAAERDRSNR